MAYLYIKALHIIFVVSWFAGLFYLPRIYVNLAMASEGAEYDRLLLMSRKLYRFVTPIMLLALGFGLWLWLGYGMTGGWLLAKLVLVAALVVYHFWCRQILRRFETRTERHSHVWFRFFNEFPVLALFAVVILVVVKPF